MKAPTTLLRSASLRLARKLLQVDWEATMVPAGSVQNSESRLRFVTSDSGFVLGEHFRKFSIFSKIPSSHRGSGQCHKSCQDAPNTRRLVAGLEDAVGGPQAHSSFLELSKTLRMLQSRLRGLHGVRTARGICVMDLRSYRTLNSLPQSP